MSICNLNPDENISLKECVDDIGDISKKAGEIALKYRSKLNITLKDVNEKGYSDLQKDNKSVVTQADFECQKYIMTCLLKKYKSFAFYGEESDGEIRALERKFSQNNMFTHGKYTFVVGPIDGTANFADKKRDSSKCYGISINILEGNEVIGGAMFFPEFNDLITTQKGVGTYINGIKVQLETTSIPNIDIPIRISSTVKDDKINKTFINKKNFNSSCYNLLALLKGEINAYIFEQVDLIDFGCSGIAIEEAGGFWGDFENKEINMKDVLKFNERGNKYEIKGLGILTISQEYHKQLIDID